MLEEISKAVSTTKNTVNTLTTKEFITNHKKIREMSLRKQSTASGESECHVVIKSRNSFAALNSDYNHGGGLNLSKQNLMLSFSKNAEIIQCNLLEGESKTDIIS